MSNSSRVFDHGLQVERTALAWRRTALAIAVAGGISARLVTESWGVSALIFTAIVLAGSVAVQRFAIGRYRRNHHRLHAEGRVVDAGIPVALVSAALLGIGAGVLAYLADSGLDALTVS